MEKLPTIEECLNTVMELNKHSDNSEELLKHKANWLYMLNKLDFFNDIPVLLEIIKFETNKNK